MTKYIIAPSLLSADFARLGEEAQAVIDAGADMLHLDVMDNHYVPNLTVGPLVCQALRDYGITAPIDVHLMVEPVDRMIEDFGKAGATNITFHPEASQDVNKSISLIKKHGCKAGLSLNPDMTLDVVMPYWDQLDLLLLMSVNPGFGGQAFIASVLDKIHDARVLIDSGNKPMHLAVDGGIKIDNIATVGKAGADMFIAGSAIYNQKNYRKIITEMRNALK